MVSAGHSLVKVTFELELGLGQGSLGLGLFMG